MGIFWAGDSVLVVVVVDVVVGLHQMEVGYRSFMGVGGQGLAGGLGGT